VNCQASGHIDTQLIEHVGTFSKQATPPTRPIHTSFAGNAVLAVLRSVTGDDFILAVVTFQRKGYLETKSQFVPLRSFKNIPNHHLSL